jgi:hypothetical protein
LLGSEEKQKESKDLVNGVTLDIRVHLIEVFGDNFGAGLADLLFIQEEVVTTVFFSDFLTINDSELTEI